MLFLLIFYGVRHIHAPFLAWPEHVGISGGLHEKISLFIRVHIVTHFAACEPEEVIEFFFYNQTFLCEFRFFFPVLLFILL